MKRHSTDAFSLIAGLFVTGVAIAALARPWRFEIGPWAGPTVLILAGVVVLGLVIASSRDDRVTSRDESLPGDDDERREAVAAAYGELDDDMTVADHHRPADDL